MEEALADFGLTVAFELLDVAAFGEREFPVDRSSIASSSPVTAVS